MGRANYKGYDLPDGLAIPDVPDDLRTLVDSGPIPRFTNAAARSAALTSPPAGAMTYQIDVGRLEVYDGTTWQLVSGITAWTAFTPVGLIGTGPATFIPHDCSYRFVGGEQVELDCAFQFYTGTGVGDNVVRFQLPFPARLPTGLTYPYAHEVGVGVYITPTAVTWPFIATVETDTYMVFRPTQWPASPSAITGASPVAMAPGVEFHFTASYRIA